MGMATLAVNWEGFESEGSLKSETMVWRQECSSEDEIRLHKNTLRDRDG